MADLSWGGLGGPCGVFLHARLVELGGSWCIRVCRLGKDRAGEIRPDALSAQSSSDRERDGGHGGGPYVYSCSRTDARHSRHETASSAAEGIGVACTLSSQSMRSMALCLAFSTLASSSVKAVSATSAGSGTWRKRKWTLARGGTPRRELAGVGAACVTVGIGTAEGDESTRILPITECGQRAVRGTIGGLRTDHICLPDRDAARGWRTAIDLPLSRRRARTAIVSLRFCKVEIARPKHRNIGRPRSVAARCGAELGRGIRDQSAGRRLVALIGAC